MAKRIQVSDDGGSNWYTLPGNTGDKSSTAGSIEDTIFGQSFQSNTPGLINASISTPAFYKGFPGYNAKVLKTGTPTGTTGEAMTLVSGKTYQINDTTKRIWDRSQTITVYDNASPVALTDIESFNYLFGEVTFTAGYTVVGAVTIDVSYLPTAVIGKPNSYELTMNAVAVRTTDFPTAQANNGYDTYQPGLRSVSLSVDGFYDATAALLAALRARSEIIIEINPDGNSKSVARGFFRATEQSESGDVGQLEEESSTFELNVPDDDKNETPFEWVHANDTTLNTGIVKCLEAWQNETTIDVRYLGDGTTGEEYTCVVTDASLSGDLDSMNEFSFEFQGSGTATAVP